MTPAGNLVDRRTLVGSGVVFFIPDVVEDSSAGSFFTRFLSGMLCCGTVLF
jgi:hypothetical protein